MSYFEEKKEPYEEGKSPIIEIDDDSDDAHNAARGGDNDDEEDPTVCDVCLIGEVYENNEILFCDKCNVAVHQLCYGVKTLPRDDDPWYCYPCAVGLDVHALKCELCCFTGGAYKYTDKAGKWAHSICANWIPEVYETHPENKPVYLNLKQLDNKRFRLKCSICHRKEGACIQCSYGRCTTSTHSWCALRNTAAGYTKRIVRDGEGGTLWEIFCKAHASAVSDPVKPKSKSKSAGSSSSSSKAFDEQPVFVPHATTATSSAVVPSSSNKRREKDSDDEGVNMKALLPALPLDDSKSDSEDDSDQEDTRTNFPVLNLIEWPGISEGDGMDTEHFWNVAMSYFPEDHSDKWLENMLNGPKSFTTDLSQVLGEHPMTVTAGTDQEDLDEISEELLATFGSEREQKHLLTYDKRDDTVQKIIETMAKFESKSPEEVGTLLDKYYAEEFFLFKNCKLLESEVVTNPTLTSQGFSELRTVFDGPEKRFAATFYAKYPATSLAEVCTVSKLGTWHMVDLLSHETDEMARNILLPVMQQQEGGDAESKQTASSAAVCLVSIQAMAGGNSVKLCSQEIVSKDRDSELSRFIRIDQDVYQQLHDSIQQKINKLLAESDLLSVAAKNSKKKSEVKKINTTYNRQQIWRRVASSLSKGVKDQNLDFNQLQEEAIPASWVIGREAPKCEEEEEEPHIDAVCMCCFDGASDDRNQILFCDGCNATIHQYCYGVGEIPEGDYFCDRCMYLQRVAHSLEDEDLDDYDIKNSVRCVLCPVTHGGLKQSSDGQWIHLCCAFWAPQTVIHNVQAMSNVDISQVPYTPVKAKSRRNLLYEASNGESGESCCYCSYSGGFLRKCCHAEAECTTHFHPLCAWFHGDHMNATVTDPSFQGADRGGAYPSGVEFSFFCEAHSVLYRPNLNTLEEQKLLRNKYRINESDLNHIPGKDRRHKSKNKKKKKAGEGETRKTSSSQTPKVLGPDVYTDKVCAICANPTSQDIFGSGYSESSFAFIETELQEVEQDLQALAESSSSSANVEVESVPVISAAGNYTNNSESNDLHDICAMEIAVERTVASQPATTTNLLGSDVPPVSTSMGSAPSKLVSCAKCNIAVHRSCLQVLNCDHTSTNPWLCEVCTADRNYEQITCQLCPRKGGYFRPTTDKEWAHPYCARTVPGQISITTAGDIDIRQVSKLAKKQKCMICNRKGGACVQCSSLGCVASFHPLCAARSGKGLVRSRHGVQTAYCSEHIPFGVELLSTGYWVDCNELLLLNSCLDRARIITDMLIRRDKHKKMICKAEMELFNIRFNKLLDRAKGRRSQAAGEVDLSDLSLNGSVSEDVSDDEDFDGDDRSKQYIVLTDIKPPSNPDMITTVITGEEVRISKHWSKKGEVKAPKLLRLSFAGIEITRKDMQSIEGGIRAYQKAYGEIIRQVEEVSRGNTGIFTCAAEEDNFLRELAPSIVRQLRMSDREYRKSTGVPGAEEDTTAPKSVKKEKKVKKGYALVEDIEDVMEVVPVDVAASPRKRGRARRDSEDLLPVIVKTEDVAEVKRSHKRKSAVLDVDDAVLSVKLETDELTNNKRGRRSSINVSSFLDEAAEEEEDTNNSNKKSRKSVGKPVEAKEEVVAKDKKPSAEDIKATNAAVYDAVHAVASKPACKEVMKFFSNSLSASNNKTGRSSSKAVVASPLDNIADKLAQDNEHLDSSEWTTYDRNTLYRLERVIQVVLNNITQYRILDTVKSSNGKKSPNKRGRGRPKLLEMSMDEEDGRGIEDDFEDIPYDLIPDYNSFVRRVVTISSMRKRLHHHGYNSLASFSNDFYTMLNNARQATISTSQTWKDTKLFAKLFEDYKRSALNNPQAIQTRVQECKLSVVPAGARFHALVDLSTPSRSSNSKAVPEKGNSSEVSILCGCCKSSYVINPWPEEFAIPDKFNVPVNETSSSAHPASNEDDEFMPTRRSSRSVNTPSYASPKSAKKSSSVLRLTHEWQWLCESCLLAQGNSLIGSEVKVWWHDDVCAYEGVVDAFDVESHCHRVLYADEEWEFVQFSQEVFLIQPNSV